MPPRTRRLLFVILLLLGSACSRSSQPADEGPVQLQFAVVEALLGPPVQLESPRLSLRPPKEWAEVDSNRVRLLGGQVAQPQDSSFLLTPVRVFLDPATGCALFVSTWSADSAHTWKQVEAQQRARLDEAAAGRQIKHDSFILAEQSCLQSLIQDSLRVNFKLLLAGGVQLDYLVPRTIYESQVELIESSLGSVTVPHQPSQD